MVRWGLARDPMRSERRLTRHTSSSDVIRTRAFAKINLTLRVLGARPDGYHEIRSTFQTVELHDLMTLVRHSGPLRLRCSDPACPTDSTNLVWRAAEELWSAAGRKGEPGDVLIRIVKRIPVQAGLGGASSDAAAALRALSVLWRVRVTNERLRDIATGLGADVPFFLEGGMALGVARGDSLLGLADRPETWVVLAVPSFGVSTAEAFGWWDQAEHGADGDGSGWNDCGNDLQQPVAERHPEIAELVRHLNDAGASYAGMSGSGSAVFGLFGGRRAADRACRLLSRRGKRVLVTRTLGRAQFKARSRPFKVAKTGR